MDLTSSIEGILDASVSTSAQMVLASLTSEDVKIIDAIVGRASSATTFLTVFKAYNEVLQELNLNSEEDIVYYKFLLKLGVVKGATWGDKWRSAKAQHGYKEANSDSSAPSTPHAFPRPQVTRPIHRILVQDYAPQKSMLLSHRRKPLPNFSAPSTSTSTSLIPSNDTSRYLERLTLARQVGGKISSSLTPPSVPSTSSTLVPIVSLRFRAKRDGLDLSSQSKGPVNLSKRPRRKDHGNLGEEDAWEKLRQAKYEKLADDFRVNTLLIKCFDVWRRGAEWIHETSHQVSEAREKITKAQCLIQWRTALSSRQAQSRRAGTLEAAFLLRRSWALWQNRVRKVSMKKRREFLRNRMKLVQKTRSLKLRKDAWAKWRQSFESRLADDKYHQRLREKIFRNWKARFVKQKRLTQLGDGFFALCEGRKTELIFRLWQRLAQLTIASRAVEARVNHNIASRSLQVWKQQTSVLLTARVFQACRVARSSLNAWKTAHGIQQHKLQLALQYESGIASCTTRQMFRIWVAKERCNLWERVQKTRTTRNYWTSWKARLNYIVELQSRADAFVQRRDASIALATLVGWIQTCKRHRQMRSLAKEFHDAHILEQTLYRWRVHLRAQLMQAQQAKVVRRFFLERSAWACWKQAIQVKMLESRAKQFELRKITSYLLEWRRLAYLKRIEFRVKAKQDTAVLKHHLQWWTNRVVDVKWLEFSTVENRKRQVLLKCWSQWRTCHIRAQDNLSLMESFRSVVQEELKRRLFTAWLLAARKCRRRRLRLEAHQTETNQAIIIAAWEQWCGRLTEERLRVPETEMQRRLAMNLTFKVFMTWQSKTKILPAIQMRSIHLRRQAWVHWRVLMPKAIRARQAREFEHARVLRQKFERWKEVWKCKVEMRSMARARYLRLSRPGEQEDKPIGSGGIGIALGRRTQSVDERESHVEREAKSVWKTGSKSAKGRGLPPLHSLGGALRPRSLASEERRLFRWRRA